MTRMALVKGLIAHQPLLGSTMRPEGSRVDKPVGEVLRLLA